VTPIRVRSGPHLDVSGKGSILALRDEDVGIRSSAEFPHASLQFFCRILRKQRDGHAPPFRPVGVTIRSDFHRMTVLGFPKYLHADSVAAFVSTFPPVLRGVPCRS